MILQVIVVVQLTEIFVLKSAVTEPSIMFLTSAKNVVLEYKYVWCNTRSRFNEGN